MAINADIDHDAAIAWITSAWTDWKDARRDKEERWTECLENYLVHIDEAKFQGWPYRCKVGDTFSQETADTIGSALRNALFPTNEEFFELQGDDDLGKTHAATFKAYLDRTLHRMKFVERLTPWCKQLAVIGNSPLLLTWETRDAARRKRVETVNLHTGERGYRIEDEKKTIYDGPGVAVLDAFDVAFDPQSTEFRRTPFIRRTKIPKDLVFSLYPDLSPADIEALEEAGASPSEPSDTQKVRRASLFGVREPSLLAETRDTQENEDVEVLEFQGDLVLHNDDGSHTRHTDILAVVLNRKLLARFERLPFWAGRTIVWGTYDQLWFTAFGKGPLEPVIGTQQLINTFSCQKADVLNLIVNGCFAFVDDGVIDPETLFLAPRHGIEVGRLDNIKELHPNTNVTLTYQEIEFLRARGERSTGKSRFDMGQAPGGRRTAYESSLIHQGGGSRDIDVVKHLANDVMEYVLEWIVGTVQQMKWDSGEIPNEVLLGEYHVNYLGADLTAMRQFDLQQMMLFLDMLGRYPAFAEAIDAPALIQEWARLFNFTQRIVKDRATYDREQAQKQAQAAMAAQPPGQNGNQGALMNGLPQRVDQEMAMLLGGQG